MAILALSLDINEVRFKYVEVVKKNIILVDRVLPYNISTDEKLILFFYSSAKS